VPPRFAYWTILIDEGPTAFRAQLREDLLPTLTQLKRTNPNAVMKWFARGRLWDSPEAAREALRAPKRPSEKRGRDWRPGGEHKDPRARFKARRKDRPRGQPPRRPRQGSSPASQWAAKPGAPRGSRPPSGKPKADRPRRRDSDGRLNASPFRPKRRRRDTEGDD
jgi:hypothetical protein